MTRQDLNTLRGMLEVLEGMNPADPEEYGRELERFREIIDREAANLDELETLDSVTDQQAAEACTDPRDLTEEQIINNRFL